jgi:NAD(P)H-nitrite reductase large subunit
MRSDLRFRGQVLFPDWREGENMLDIEEKLKEIGPYVPEEDDDLLVCRCEEVTKGEIRKALHEGITTIEELRRLLRCGMGLCQGQTCGTLTRRLVAKELHIRPADVTLATARTPMRPLDMGIAGNDRGAGEDLAKGGLR